MQREVGDLFLRCDPALVDRADHQSDVLQKFQAGGLVAHTQDRAHDHLGLLSPEQRLAVHVDPGVQIILLGLVLEAGQRGERPMLHNQRIRTRLGTEGDHDPAVFVGRELAPLQPDLRVRKLAVDLIQNHKGVSARRDALQQSEATLLNQRAAAAPVADQLHHVHAPLGKLRKIERPEDAPFGRLGVGHLLLVRRHQPVQIDGQVQRLACLAIVVEGVDFEDLDDQRRHVLDVGANLHRVVQTESLGVVGRKLNLHTLFQFTVFRRRQHGGPLLRIADAVEDLAHGENAFQKILANPLPVSVIAVRILHEVHQVIPHQRLLVAHRGKGDQARFLVQVRQVVTVRQLAPHVLTQVGHIARQLNVLHKAVFLVVALFTVVLEPIVQRVGL